MKPLTMLVTPDARWVLPDTSEFLQALGDPAPDYDCMSFAVKNLGFIKLQIFAPSLVEIELHPRNVEIAALRAVQQQLLASAATLFRIKYLEDAWRSEISASREHTVARLAELCRPMFVPPPSERFQAEPQDPSTLLHHSSHQANPLRSLAQKWRVSFGAFDLNTLSLATRPQLQTAIVGINPRQRDPILRFFGDGHNWAGSYKVTGIGEKVENMPDKEYGGWLASFYRAVAEVGQPRYDLVTAAIQYQAENGKPLRLVHYERLLLPWRTPSGEVFVTCCSRLSDPEEAGNVPSAADEDSSAAR